jgi:type I restriction enzyme R subunit
MSRVGEIERITQNRVVKLFEEKLGYKYLGNLKDEENNRNVETRILRNYLREKGYSEKLIERALSKLNRAVTNQSNSLYDVNKEVYGYLRYGIEVRENVGENKQTVRLINWDETCDNDFYQYNNRRFFDSAEYNRFSLISAIFRGLTNQNFCYRILNVSRKSVAQK